MTFAELATSIVAIVDRALLPLLYALALLFFLYGVASAFFSSNEEKRKEGKQVAFWGIIALVVLFGLWGFVELFLSLLR